MNSSSYFELWLLVCSLHRYIINGSMTATTSVSHWHQWSSSDLLLKNNHKTELVCFPDCLDFDSLDVASKLLVITGFHPMSQHVSMYGRSTASGCEESLRKDVGFGNQDVVIPVTLHNLNKDHITKYHKYGCAPCAYRTKNSCVLLLKGLYRSRLIMGT